MKSRLFVLFISIFLFSGQLFAQEEQKQKEPEELAAEEATRLEKLLELAPDQTFYVDSILSHDMRAMKNEMEEMQRSGMQNFQSYQMVQDRWRKQIESGYKKIFNEKQWLEYMKISGYYTKEYRDSVKAEKARIKKMEKAKRKK